MSGDVQPRKRKDKKRRKEDGDPAHPPVFANSPASDDVNIHVHKEGGTGGNICAKLVFFVLFSALAVLIGLIITEHRGLTDLDSVDAESRYSHIFEGLVDSGLDGHEDHEDHGIEEDFNSREIDQVDGHDDNDEELDVSELEEEEEEEPSGEDDKSGGDQSEELSIEDSRADEPEEENESDVSQEQDEDDEADEEIQNDEDEDDIPAEDDEIEDIDEEIDDAVEESDEYYQDEQQNSEEDNEEQNKVGTEEVDDAEEDETDDNGYDVGGNNADQIEGDDDDDGIEGNVDDVAEENELNEEEGFEHIKNKMDISDDDVEQASSAEDISEETRHEDDLVHSSEEKVVENIFEEKESKIEEGQSEQDVQESSGMAVRLGVGIAILVVAHLVLVRKWRTADDSKLSIPNEQSEAVPDLSRRNTIIIPPNYQEIEADIENDEEDYSEELSDNEEPIEGNHATYLRSLTPDSDPDHEKSPKPYEYDDDENSIEEEEESNEEDYEIEDVDEEDDDDDEELLKRLEAKYGKLHGGGGDQVAESWKRINLRQDVIEDSDFDSDRQSDDEEYQNMNITNKDDFQIRKEIEEAQKSVESNPSYAMKLFDAILRKNPSSPRSLYGKAVCLDALADEKQSNAILEKALTIYSELLEREDVPPILYRLVTDRCIKRMRFIGQYKNLLKVHMQVIKRFPDDPKFRNELAVTYLTINRIENARSVLKEVLSRWPRDGYALVHYGFILKTADNNLEEAVRYLSDGLKTGEEGVEDGRFYFHLGDALTRLGRKEEANEVYEKGAENKVFLSKYQRSLYNVPRLTGNPWWQKEKIQNPLFVDLLEHYWEEIRREGLSILNSKGYFQDESENLRDTGEWKQFELYARGRRNAKNCQKCPVTCSIIDRIPEAKFCRRGQTKFSVMHPGTHVWPHCGPTNCRLRTHLGLVVPPKTFLRVADETRSWDEGKVIVFDDSFEHEVWHNGTGIRLVLIVDIWHPELTAYEKNSLSAI